MTDLRELYQEVILDHTRHPRNLREMPDADRTAEGYNPLCGDRATIYLRFDGDVIQDASFVGKGCSISTASASMMTEALKGKTREQVERLFEKFHALVTTGPAAAEDPELGKLSVFAGVSEFPVRVKCASLAWHTMRSAMAGQAETISTE